MWGLTNVVRWAGAVGLCGAAVMLLGCRDATPAGAPAKPTIAAADTPVRQAIDNVYARVAEAGGGADYLAGLARELQANGFVDEAIETYAGLAADEALSDRSRHLYALALMESGNHDAAIQQWRMLQARAQPRLNLYLADALLAADQVEEATAAADAATEEPSASWPGDAPRRAAGLAALHAQVLAARCAVERGEYSAAEQHANVLFGDQRTGGEAVRLFAAIAVARGEDARAASWRQMARADDPLPPFVDPVVDALMMRSSSRAVLRRAAIDALDQGDGDWARTMAQRLMSLYPDDVDGHGLLATTMLRTGREAEASAHVEAVVARVDDLQLGIARRLASALFTARQFEPYVPLIERVLAAGDDHASQHHNLGIARASIGDLAGAIASYERAVELMPAEPRYVSSLAQTLMRNGQAGQAQPMVDALVQARPNDPRAHVTRAQVLSAMGDVDGAREACARALEINPEFGPAKTMMAGLLR